MASDQPFWLAVFETTNKSLTTECQPITIGCWFIGASQDILPKDLVVMNWTAESSGHLEGTTRAARKYLMSFVRWAVVDTEPMSHPHVGFKVKVLRIHWLSFYKNITSVDFVEMFQRCFGTTSLWCSKTYIQSCCFIYLYACGCWKFPHFISFFLPLL